MKTRQCISCGNLTDSPGEYICKRCKIEHGAPPKKFKLLLVDDDINFSRDLKQKLESTLHYEVIPAYDGMKGYEKLDYEKPDAVLLNVILPLLNGSDFVKKMRAREEPEIKKIPIIILLHQEKMKKFFQPWDVQGFALKPVDLKKLFNLLQILLPQELSK